MSGYTNKLKQYIDSNARGEGVEINNRPSLGWEDAGAQITRGDRHWEPDSDGNYVVTFGFMNQENFPGYDGNLKNGYTFSEQQEQQTRLALQSWSDVADIKFVEVSEDADIFLANAPQRGSAGVTYSWTYTAHPDQLAHANVWIADDYTNPQLGNYSRMTLTHELGHAIGIKHPADYNASDNISPTYQNSAIYAEDNRQFTLMSYFSEQNTGADFKGASSPGPLLDDIASVQRLYGANQNAFSDDTVYGFNSNTDRDYLSATSGSDKIIFSAWDTGGNDTFDFSQFTQDQVINLNQLSFSNVGGLTKNVSIAGGVEIENAIAGSGDDYLIGNALDNQLIGGAGDDVIFGGLGADTLTGGSGSDIFIYTSLAESTKSQTDTITDFESGVDKIDLSAVSALLGNDLASEFNQDTNTTTLYANIDNSEAFNVDVVGQINLSTDLILSA